VEDKANTAAPEVNRLYWQTGDSVADISNNLGISRRALYEMIEPLAAGVECSSCGAEMHFANRSAKSASIARCMVCGSEQELDSGISHDDIGIVPPYTDDAPRANKTLSVANGARDRVVMVAGFALAGLVVGAVATLLVRKRR
jgi:DNA-binding transcriptional regulator LsrR (DeoR family)